MEQFGWIPGIHGWNRNPMGKFIFLYQVSKYSFVDEETLLDLKITIWKL